MIIDPILLTLSVMLCLLMPLGFVQRRIQFLNGFLYAIVMLFGIIISRLPTHMQRPMGLVFVIPILIALFSVWKHRVRLGAIITGQYVFVAVMSKQLGIRAIQLCVPKWHESIKEGPVYEKGGNQYVLAPQHRFTTMGEKPLYLFLEGDPIPMTADDKVFAQASITHGSLLKEVSHSQGLLNLLRAMILTKQWRAVLACSVIAALASVATLVVSIASYN